MVTGCPQVYACTILQEALTDHVVQTEIYTSAWAVTHDPQNFHHPYEFIPSRWLENEAVDNRAASQPFSLGPRGCLGRR